MPTANQESRLAELRENLDRVRADQEIRLYESQLGLASQMDRVFETADAFAYSDPTRRNLTAPGSMDRFHGGRPDDYKDGKCWPLYETEQDLQELRSIGRWFANWDEMGISILTNLRNYTIGVGFTTQCNPLDKSEESAALAVELQRFCDEFDRVNKWLDESESEVFTTSIYDGERLLRLKPRGTAAPKVQMIGGEHLTEPANPAELEDHYGLPSLNWKFGIATEHGDTTEVAGYFVDWYGSQTDWEFIPEEEAVFVKRNTPSQAKRGVGDFSVVWRTLDRGTKLFENTVIGATGQASIMYIKEVLGQTPGDALGGYGGPMSGVGTAYNGNGQAASVPTERILGGKIITTNGKYHSGPLGSPNGPVFMDILQGVARRVGSRWAMPEYMVSGDASNANYASTMVAESPFVQNTKQEQGSHARRSAELRWKAVRMAAKYGRFGGLTVEEMELMVEISVEGPDPVSRDPVALETVRDKQQAAGVLSPRTRAQQSDLDYDEEVANGAKVAAPQLATVASSPVSEARIRDLRFSLLEGSE